MKILSLHERNPHNIGDMSAEPTQYFESRLKDAHIDKGHILHDWHRADQYDLVILGGGGLLREPYLNAIKHVVQRSNRFATWGTGLTDKGVLKILKGDVSVRHEIYDPGASYVPCVSCLHPAFNNTEEETPSHGQPFYFIHQAHVDIVKTLRERNSLMAINTGRWNVAEIVTKMRKASYVVTTSYHGSYWAALLNKPCYVYVKDVSELVGGKWYECPFKYDLTTGLFPDRPPKSPNEHFLATARILNHQFADKIL